MRVVACASELETKFDQLHAQGVAAFETGLLLGCRANSVGKSEQLDVVLETIKTPNKDEEVKKASFDTDWFVSHAVQVSRMLPAGFEILGIYIYAPELAALDSLPGQLIPKMIASLAISGESHYNSVGRSFTVLQRKSLSSGLGCLELVIEKCSSTKPPILTKAVPAEFRFTKNAASQIACIKCTCPVDLQIFLPSTAASKQKNGTTAREIFDTLHSAIRVATEKLHTECSNVILTSGGLVVDDLESIRVGEHPIQVELKSRGNFPLVNQVVPASVQVAGVASIRASVASICFTHERNSFGVAKELLVQDIARTLAVRMSMARDELGVDDDDEEGTDAEYITSVLFEQGFLQLSRRVFINIRGVVGCCEYLSPDDPDSVAIDTWREILGMDVSESDMKAMELESHLGGLSLQQIEEEHENSKHDVVTQTELLSKNTNANNAKNAGLSPMVVTLAVLLALIAIYFAL